MRVLRRPQVVERGSLELPDGSPRTPFVISTLLWYKYFQGAYDGSMAMLDTLRASQQLQQAGIEAGHADALVTTFSEGFAERLATRDELHAEIEDVRADLRSTEARLLAEIASVRAELQQTEERLQGQMHQLENRLMRWTIATLLAGMGIAAAIAAAIVQVVG